MKKQLLFASILFLAVFQSFGQLTITNATGSTICDGAAVINNQQWSPLYWMNSSNEILKQGGDFLDSLCPGSYVLKFDSSGYQGEYPFTIGLKNNSFSCANFKPTLNLSPSSSTSSCNGSASVNAPGGSTYYWDNGYLGSSIIDQCPGLVSVVVTLSVDGLTCTDTLSGIIPTDSSSTGNPCAGFNPSYQILSGTTTGQCKGVAKVTIPSGANWFVSWSNGVTGGVDSTLCAGSNSVTVSIPGTNCSTTLQFYIEKDTSSTGNPCAGFNPSYQILSGTPTGQCKGAAKVNIPSGANWSVSWSNGATGGVDSSLCAGSNSVTVSIPGTNCSTTLQFNIPTDSSSTGNPCAGFNPSYQILSGTPTGQCKGAAKVNIPSGANWSVSWSNGATGGVDSSLCAGSNSVTVSIPGTNCSTTLQFNIPTDSSSTGNPCAGFNPSYQILSGTTTGQCKGVAKVTIPSSANWFVSWSNGVTGGVDSTLCAGSNSVTVSIPGTNCSTTLQFYIEKDTSSTGNPCAGFNPSVAIQKGASPAACNGKAVVNIPVGANWSCQWSNKVFGPLNANLCAGNVSVNVALPGTSCQVKLDLVIPVDTTPPCQPITDVVISSTNADAGGCNGTATVTVPTTNNYTFYWSNGANTSSTGNLCQGIVKLVVKDTVTGCTGTYTAQIQGAPGVYQPLRIYLNTDDATDLTTCNGRAKVIAIGGKPGYKYSFLNSTGSTIAADSTIGNLCPGKYTVRVEDSNKEVYTMDFLIAGPQNVIVNTNPVYLDSTVVDTLITQVEQNCGVNFPSVDSVWIENVVYVNKDSMTATWKVRDVNGIKSFEVTYLISNAVGIFSLELSVFCPTKSEISFIKASDQFYINYQDALSVEHLIEEVGFNVYPNPSNGKIHLRPIRTLSNVELRIYNSQGQELIKNKYSVMNEEILELPFSSGIYLIKLESDQGSMIQRAIVK